jgi:hypothetical protein
MPTKSFPCNHCPSLIVLVGEILRWSDYFEAAFHSAEAFSLRELWTNCQVAQSDRLIDLVILRAIGTAN